MRVDESSVGMVLGGNVARVQNLDLPGEPFPESSNSAMVVSHVAR